MEKNQIQIKESVIQELNSSVIDQISAGEVVERPAGLVKELIENALDAGAKSIEIQFSDGGQFVCVKDDGHGIPANQLSLALARHATSKIQKAGDLFSIQSYGFRGEALASIASVSVLSLISQVKDSGKAYRLKSEFGKTFQIENVSGSPGTTVIVDRLFQNTPARLRFLKSESVETLAIKNVITAQALSRWDVSFRVIHKGRLLFYWPACSSLLERAEMILLIKPLYHHTHSLDYYKAEVVLSAPNKTAKTAKKMWFFVNGRIVEDKTLYGAVMSAHRNLLMHGEYPIIIIFLTLPPTEVDVNIHPTKTKIRLRNSSKVFRIVQNTVRDLLEKGPWLTHLTLSAKELLQEKPVKKTFIEEKQSSFDLKNRQSRDLIETGKLEQNHSLIVETDHSMNADLKKDQGLKKPSLSEDFYSARPPLNKERFKHSSEKSSVEKNFKESPYGVSQGIKNLSKTFSSLKVLAQAHKTYIVTQSPLSIVFIDQHAAHERILFEKLMAGFKNNKPISQKLLLALKVKLDPAEISALMSMKPSFQSLGIEWDQKAEDEIHITSSPLFIKGSAIETVVKQLAHQHIQRAEEFTVEKVVSHVSAEMACHSAIRAGQTLSIEEMTHLLEQMEQFALSSFCPHGRPVFVEYPISKLEKDFGRVV